MPVTILIVANHALLRESLRDWLTMVLPRWVTIEVTCEAEAVAPARAGVPRVSIVDLDAAEAGGIEAVQHVKAALPDVPVVALGLDETEVWRAKVAAAGATAYVPKSALQTELIPILKSVLAQPSGTVDGQGVCSERS